VVSFMPRPPYPQGKKNENIITFQLKQPNYTTLNQRYEYEQEP